MPTGLVLRSGVGPGSTIASMILRGLGGQVNEFLVGLSLTKPNADGGGVTEPNWPGYGRQFLLMSPTAPFVNSTPIVFNTLIPPNTYYDVHYFTIYDFSNNFVLAGSITGLTEVGPAATLTILPGNLISTLNSTAYLPNTSNIAFMLVTYPPFVPTYEPASLSTPILYRLNMRS